MAIFNLTKNERLAPDVFRFTLSGDARAFTRPGQFAQLTVPGFFLRRPVSACDFGEDFLTLVFRAQGAGTLALSEMPVGAPIDLLPGLGNGYDVNAGFARPLVAGGGLGVPPLYALTRALLATGAKPTVALGFNRAQDAILTDEFRALGVRVCIATLDGSLGQKGFVTDLLPGPSFDGYYACGPEPMLRALCKTLTVPGFVSLEERMACGFGACMGCARKTKNGMKRVCADGPVFPAEDLLW